MTTTCSNYITAEIKMFLNSLGETPEEIAQSLHALGIKGNKACERTCPIARYLQSKELDHPEALIDDIYFWIDGKKKWVATPPQIGEFIKQFDDGCYPNLEQSEAS